MDAVVVFRNDGQSPLTRDLQIDQRVDGGGMERLIRVIDRLAGVVDIIFVFLLCRDRDLVSAEHGDGVGRGADERESVQLKIEFVSIARVDHDVAVPFAGYRVNAVRGNGGEGQRGSIDRIAVLRAGKAGHGDVLRLCGFFKITCVKLLRAILSEGIVKAAEVACGRGFHGRHAASVGGTLGNCFLPAAVAPGHEK